jgi:hypothetical protein
MLPFPVLRVERIKERMLLHQLPHLLLREGERLFEEVSGVVRKMNHFI